MTTCVTTLARHCGHLARVHSGDQENQCYKKNVKNLADRSWYVSLSTENAVAL